MRVHLINLDRSPERLATMRQALAERGVGFERLSAIDGRALGAEVLARHPDISAGEIGCLLSHRAAWKLIADGDEPFGAVLEDDGLLSRSIRLFTANTAWIPEDANLVKLETWHKRILAARTATSHHAGRSIVRLYSPHLGAAGYIISRPTAAALLTEDAANVPVDVLLFGSTVLKIYQVAPALCTQDGGDSFIEEERRRHGRQRHGPLARHGRKLLRSLKRRIAIARTRLVEGEGNVELGAIPFGPD
jgi:glycosyl transferase family 25